MSIYTLIDGTSTPSRPEQTLQTSSLELKLLKERIALVYSPCQTRHFYPYLDSV